ncbi:MAG: hypothetical protein HKM07_07730 [Chlamydiae bacterium]|nr:hypothetical protein [Chlamydiota bacterium]
MSSSNRTGPLGSFSGFLSSLPARGRVLSIQENPIDGGHIEAGAQFTGRQVVKAHNIVAPRTGWAASRIWGVAAWCGSKAGNVFQMVFSAIGSVTNAGLQESALVVAGDGEGSAKSGLIGNYSKYQVSLSNHVKALLKAKIIPHEGVRIATFRYICTDLLKKENVLTEEILTLLLEIASSFNTKLYQDRAWDCLSRIFVSKGDFDKSIETAKRIQDRNMGAAAFSHICKALIEKEDFAKVTATLQHIPKAQRIYVERGVAAAIEKRARDNEIWGDFTKAIEVANEISDPKKKSIVLARIATAFIAKITLDVAAENEVLAQENVNLALKAVYLIPDEKLRSRFLERIWEVYAPNQNRVWSNLSRTLALEGEFDKSIEMAKRIQDPDISAAAFSHICRALIEKEEFAKAIATMQHIPKAQRIFVEKGISAAIEKQVHKHEISGDFTKAVEAANEIPDSKRKSMALARLATTFIAKIKLDGTPENEVLAQENVNLALKAVYLIPDEKLRSRFLARIWQVYAPKSKL